METFPTLLAPCGGIKDIPVWKGPEMRSFGMIFLVIYFKKAVVQAITLAVILGRRDVDVRSR